MKRFVIFLLVIVALALSVATAAHIYRDHLYNLALQYEASQADLKSAVIEPAGRKIAFLHNTRQEGQEAVVLLHGFGASKESWLRYARYLSDDYYLVAIDLAGHGGSVGTGKRSYDIASQVEFVRLALESMGLDRFHLVGNSMGGAVAALYAATYRRQVLSSVLISPAGVHDVPAKMDLMLKEGRNPLIPGSKEEFYDLLDFVMEDKPFIPWPIVAVEAEKSVARKKLNEKIFADLRSDLETGLTNRLKMIQCPVLIIWGEQDRAINVANIDRYAELVPNATKLILPNIGHLAMIEVPETSAHASQAFFRNPPGNPSPDT